MTIFAIAMTDHLGLPYKLSRSYWTSPERTTKQVGWTEEWTSAETWPSLQQAADEAAKFNDAAKQFGWEIVFVPITQEAWEATKSVPE